MFSYIVLIKDIQFLLYDLLKVSEQDVFGYDELDCEFIGVVLDEVGKLVSEVLVLLNVVGDIEGCMFENGVVCMLIGFKEVFEQMKEGGWIVFDCDFEYGGQGLFYLMMIVVNELFVLVNMVFNMYQGLIYGVYLVIYVYGLDE